MLGYQASFDQRLRIWLKPSFLQIAIKHARHADTQGTKPKLSQQGRKERGVFSLSEGLVNSRVQFLHQKRDFRWKLPVIWRFIGIVLHVPYIYNTWLVYSMLFIRTHSTQSLLGAYSYECSSHGWEGIIKIETRSCLIHYIVTVAW